ncbi:hypothetical protein FB45DRAFT_942421 [Roridomyces roridus]|uniref:Uncharacterized protein n=1 Tax=Roridomyces roridus TaxID=1738132 RepID=A0AAD7B5P2_9AGAR|nr:hypothetical protein FB45DRAFT_942421 [Roridomyces roridus]
MGISYNQVVELWFNPMVTRELAAIGNKRMVESSITIEASVGVITNRNDGAGRPCACTFVNGSVAGLSRVGISDPYPYPHVSARALRYSRTVKTNELAEDFVFARGARECGARTSDDTINDAVVLFLLQPTFCDLSLACRGGEERGSAARRGARTSDD